MSMRSGLRKFRRGPLMATLLVVCGTAHSGSDSTIYSFGGSDAGAVFDTLDQAEAALRSNATHPEYATAGLSFPIFSKVGSEWRFRLVLDYRPYGGLSTNPPASLQSETNGIPGFKLVMNGGGDGGPPPQVPDCGAGGPGGGSGEGDPCVVASGNQSLNEYDFTYGAINFSRHYNSLRMLRPYAAINYNWSHNFAQRVLTSTLVQAHGTIAGPEAPFIVAQDARAHAEFYRQVTPGTATTPGVFRSTVQRGKVMTVRTVSEGVYEYVIHYPDGHREYYDNAGTVTRVYYPDDMHHSLVITSTVQPSTILPLIDTVTDGNGVGRRIKFTYTLLPDDPYQHLLKVSGYRTQGGYEDLLRLTYDTEHGYQQQNLLSIQRAGPNGSTTGGKIRRYRYGENTPVPLPLHLTTIEDENEETYASFTYDYHGRALTSVIGGIAQQTAVNYVPNTQDKSVSATRALGGRANYAFNSAVGSGAAPGDQTFRKPTSLTYKQGLPTLNDTPPAYTETWVYGYQDTSCSTDDERLCRYKDPQGVVTEYQYDTLFERVRIEGAGTPAARRIETDYDPVVYRPSERRTYSGEQQLAANLSARVSYVYDQVSGALRATCEYDVDDPAAMAYVCSPTVAPAVNVNGVRRRVQTYCTGPTSNPQTLGCPAAGWLLSTADPRGNVTSYLYYTVTWQDLCGSDVGPCHYKGDLAIVTNSLGQTTTYERYDSAGRPRTILPAHGAQTRMYYTPEGWVSKQTLFGHGLPIGGASTEFAHDNTGKVTSVTDPDGVSTTYEYDAAHRLTDIEDELGNRIHFDLDTAGNRIGESTSDPSDVLKRTLSRQYDSLNRLTSELDAYDNAQNHSYNSTNQIRQVADANGVRTAYVYDGLGRLKDSIRNYNLLGSAPDENVTTHYEHDAKDNLTAVVDPDSLTTSYAYDGLSNLRSLQSPDTGTTTYTYDRSGNRISSTDARNVTAMYGFDALSRLTDIDYPTAGQDVAFLFDQTNAITGCWPNETVKPYIGRLSRLDDSTGSTTYCYDSRGNVLDKTQVTGTLSFHVGYTYTAGGRPLSITYPSGAILTYGYDVAGRVTSLTYKTNAGATPQVIVGSIAWYPFGPMRQLTYGDGHTLTRTHDLNYAIDSITSSLATGLQLDYAIDDVGNVESIVGRINNGPLFTDTAGYDPLYRLRDYSSSGGSPVATDVHAYEYNRTGDRTKYEYSLDNGADTGVVNYTYLSGTHHLGNVSAGSGTGNRNYTPAGNTSSMGGMTFIYNDANRLVRSKLGPDPTDYKINGKGERVQKRDFFTGISTFVYDEDGKLLGDYSSSGAAIQEYIYMDGFLVATLKGGTIRYIEADHLGSPRAAIDPVRHVAVWAWSPFGDAFGATAAIVDPDNDGQSYSLPIRFPGQYYDSETQLHYNYFRDYEASTGRYLQADLLSYDGSANLYTYVENSPLYSIDPSGLEAQPESPKPKSFPKCVKWRKFPSPCAPNCEETCVAAKLEMNRDCMKDCTKRWWQFPIFWTLACSQAVEEWGRQCIMNCIMPCKPECKS